MSITLASKVCGRCRVEKPMSEFYVNRANADGRAWECKACALERVRLNRQERIKRLGLDVVRERERQQKAAHHARTGGENRSAAWSRVRSEVIKDMIEAHRAEYEARMKVALYEAGLR